MQRKFTLLDGGTGRELLRMGAPFRQPEWSALALMEAPEYVTRVHQHYIEAGADLITTNSYAVVPFHIGAERFAREGYALAALSGRLAREAADLAGRPVRVAGSLPPICGSYRPDLFDAAVARPIVAQLVRALQSYVDLWLMETVSSQAEMALASEAVAVTGKPWWVSYTLTEVAATRVPQLRSGEPVEAAVLAAASRGASAVLFNCSQPEVIGAAVAAARRALDEHRRRGASHVRVGAYANAFPPQSATARANEGLNAVRDDLAPAQYLEWVRRWLADGAEIVGGCCGVGPEHIALMHTSLP
jgi:S-methylmethionine-dependent homocysteine/selenocysteine methylase